MNAARVIARIHVLRAELDSLEAEIQTENGGTSEPSPWCKPDEYAAHANVSVATVLRWCHAGMPHAKGPIRINKEEGDAWRTKR